MSDLFSNIHHCGTSALSKKTECEESLANKNTILDFLILTFIRLFCTLFILKFCTTSDENGT